MYKKISKFKTRCSITSIIVFVLFLSGALQVHAKCFIIDPIPNSYRLTDKEITERIRYGVLSNRKKSKVPIIVSESYPQADIYRPFALLTDNILQVS